jgi:DNA-directed RNA polymerase specialized sigma24 family protein
LTIEEVAEVTKTSPATVKRELQAAKLWLKRMITQGEFS